MYLYGFFYVMYLDTYSIIYEYSAPIFTNIIDFLLKMGCI